MKINRTLGEALRVCRLADGFQALGRADRRTAVIHCAGLIVKARGVLDGSLRARYVRHLYMSRPG